MESGDSFLLLNHTYTKAGAILSPYMSWSGKAILFTYFIEMHIITDSNDS
jgi:hypothetical protein